MHGTLVWKEFQTAVNLKSIVRQGLKEQQFKNVLLSLRTYSTTPEQAIWLQQFQWADLQSKYGISFMSRMSDEGLFVFPTHLEVWQHNKSKLKGANEKYPIAKINTECQGPHSKNW